MQGYIVQGLLLVSALVGAFQSAASGQDWTPEFLSETRTINCVPGKIERNVTFLHGTESGDFKKLGKVAAMDVCVLLCCEMEKCEAAFMANRNCFAVQCRSPEHCVTAPAHQNIWHPSVTFVKRISQSLNDNKQLTQKPTNTTKEILSNGVTENKAVESGNNGHVDQVKEKVKHAKIPQIPSLDIVPGIMNSLRIPSKSKTETIQMAASDRKPVVTLDKPKTWREEKMKKSREGLVSAAVVTCSMAFLLSFAAVIAAKIRKRKEMNDNAEYSTVPNTEQTDAVESQ